MEIRTNEPMARHTSFRVGGPADRFMIPESEGELREAVLDCKASGKPWYMVGNGSNLLVGDKGFRGTIISTERLAELEVQKNEKKPFRQIAATPLPHYKSLRRERGGLEGEREALLQKGFPLQVSYSSNTRLRMSPSWRR